MGRRPARPGPILRHIHVWVHKNPPESQLFGQGQEEEEVGGAGNGAPPPLSNPVGSDAKTPGQGTPVNPASARNRSNRWGKSSGKAYSTGRWTRRWRPKVLVLPVFLEQGRRDAGKQRLHPAGRPTGQPHEVQQGKALGHHPRRQPITRPSSLLDTPPIPSTTGRQGL